ncbi:hypothetical protein GCM10023169_31480 [Georgenia halophila]|uniref:AGE family epimerase/isomerase n=1 Tax=Georgenia halophila TaxID=620889 RepID=A0ABP8LIA0_9MICO
MEWLIDSPDHHRRLSEETERLLRFGRASRHGTAFGWLDDEGRPTPDVPDYLYVTCRMTHTYAMGDLLGSPGAAKLVDHGLASLRGTFRDRENGGWFTAMDGSAVHDARKWAYPHAFVVLAAASAAVAGRPGASELLAEATDLLEGRFWDDDAGMLVEEWDATFVTLSGYRGANANMHGVEAMLAAYGATGASWWLDRAERVCRRMVDEARHASWRLPEHYDSSWQPDPEHNRDHPDDPFKPYGTTPGHSFEWARLLVQLRAGLEQENRDVPTWLLEGARALTGRAVEDAWAVDGAPGFVYTVDWSGRPVIHQRLHWVLCEALGAAASLWAATGEERYARWYEDWWSYAERAFVDPVGSWHHELDRENRPAATIRPGKADLYHAAQATVLPRVPLAPSLAVALRRAASCRPGTMET